MKDHIRVSSVFFAANFSLPAIWDFSENGAVPLIILNMMVAGIASGTATRLNNLNEELGQTYTPAF